MFTTNKKPTSKTPAFLLTWNPTQSPADEAALVQAASDLASSQTVEFRWSAGNSQHIQPGARVFLLRQGSHEPGLVGSGHVIRGSYRAPHRDPAKRRAGKQSWFVDVRWDTISPLNPIITRAELLRGIMPAELLKVASSGVTITHDTVLSIETPWSERCRASSSTTPTGTMPPPTLSAIRFQQQFGLFELKVRNSSGQPFTSFQSGLPATWEDYKERVRAEALTILQPHRWRPKDLKKNTILEHLISAIEIDLPGRHLRNNLVRWENRWGHASRSHRALLDARSDQTLRSSIQNWGFSFFSNRTEPPAAFEQLRTLIGNRYDLIAYLFFLKDSSRFMPIAPTTFDQAFQLLGIDLVTARSCSWDNYCRFNGALSEVQAALRDQANIADARLIDAHSFCWMLVRLGSQPVPSTAIPLPEPFEGVVTAASQQPSPRSTNGQFQVMTEDDFVQLEQQRRRLGSLAQDIALQSERKRLRSLGCPNPDRVARPVWHEPARGYDIHSQEPNGAPRHIEVKAARFSSGKLSFFLSENERKKAHSSSTYYFYLVLNPQSQSPAVRVLQSHQLTPASLVPTNYIAGLQVSDA